MTTRSELNSIGLGADRGFERTLSRILCPAKPELVLPSPQGQHNFYVSTAEPPVT